MAGRLVPVRGDAHLGNFLLSDRRPLWTDFEDIGLGPHELDFGGLPSTAWARFEDADQWLTERCGGLKSIGVAVWC